MEASRCDADGRFPRSQTSQAPTPSFLERLEQLFEGLLSCIHLETKAVKCNAVASSPLAESRQTTMPSLLERLQSLPEELQALTFSYLTYQDAIRLSQVNRWFHLKVEPERCSEHEKTEFVFKAQFRNKHNIFRAETFIGRLGFRAPMRVVKNGHACYRCYRVRPPTKFSRSMIKNYFSKHIEWTTWSPHWRYCTDCAICCGAYRTGMTLSVTIEETRDSRGAGGTPRNTYKKMPLVICEGCEEAAPYVTLLNARLCEVCRKTYDDHSLSHTVGGFEEAKQGFAKVWCLNCGTVQLSTDPRLKCAGYGSCQDLARLRRKDVKDQARRQKQILRRRAKASGPGLDLLEDGGEGLAGVAWL